MTAVMLLLQSYQAERPGADILINGFINGSALLKRMDTHGKYDIYLLDVVMPEIGGIELAQEIRARDPEGALVFLTGSTEHALAAFGVSAAQYILKPIKKEALFPVLDKLIAERKHEEDKYVMVSASNGHTVRVLHSHIILIERIGRSLRYVLDSGKALDSVSIRSAFETAVSELLSDKRFLLAHQSFVVNMDHVSELFAGAFVMKNGMEVSIPKQKYAFVKNRYLEYLSESRK